MVANKPGAPGRLRISVKTIAQGRPGVLGCTCGTCRLHFVSRRAAGVSRRLAFPAPSAFRGAELSQISGVIAARRHWHVQLFESWRGEISCNASLAFSGFAALGKPLRHGTDESSMEMMVTLEMKPHSPLSSLRTQGPIPRKLSVRRNCQSSSQCGPWLWVPAFAGTTAGYEEAVVHSRIGSNDEGGCEGVSGLSTNHT